MPSVEELIRDTTELTTSEIERIHDLLGSWQLVADLSFADLMLWCNLRNHEGFVCVAQMRPYTAQTLHPEDVFAMVIRPEEFPIIDRAFAEGRMWQRDEPVLLDGVHVRMEAIPVSHGGKQIAVMTKEGAPLTHRRPGRLETNYLECANELSRMIAEATFPFERENIHPETMPRVGDGLIRLDRSGVVRYASPNAMSALRRLGSTSSIEGELISASGIDANEILDALDSARPHEGEQEQGGTVVLHRFIPFLRDGLAELGGLLLIRDVTELRHRERMLQRKDAVILEIHHRVKNNLQTIASLLRLQSRRLSSQEAKKELEEAVRRIASIALVHETLASEGTERVDFSTVAAQIIGIVSHGLTVPEKKMTFEFRGHPAEVSAEVASPLAVVLVELLQNAVEHAFGAPGGRVEVICERRDKELTLEIKDDGKGFDVGVEKGGLGLQIVRALVVDELGGRIDIESDGGTKILLAVPVRKPGM